MKIKKFLPLLMILLFTTQSYAAVTIYTDRSAWESALGSSYSEEFFEDAVLNPDISVVSDVGYVDTINQYWWDRLAPGGDQTTFSFSGQAIAFGGHWDLAGPGGVGTGIQLTLINGGTYDIPDEIPNTTGNNEFWGFISDTAFTSVRLTAGTQAVGVDTYTMDSMVYAFSSSTPAVPIPTINEWGMIIFSLLLAGSAIWMMRRRQVS